MSSIRKLVSHHLGKWLPNTLEVEEAIKSFTKELEKPKEKTTVEERKAKLRERGTKFALDVHAHEQYPIEMRRDFIRYWCEANASFSKMKFELQKTFEIERRLVTWANNDKKIGTHRNSGEPRAFRTNINSANDTLRQLEAIERSEQATFGAGFDH